MSIFQALTRAYDRLAEQRRVPLFGYSSEKIGFVIVLDGEGRPVGPPADLRQGEGKKRVAPPMNVPNPVKRTSGIASNLLWDKTSYALGVTSGDGKRTALEHVSFIERHQEALAGTEDAGLRALLAFLESWKPEHFAALGWPEEMKDQNVAFALVGEHRERRIHDRLAAKALLEQPSTSVDGGKEARCLVTGKRAAIARLHPAIKGVWGAQSSGASIVSFNADAYESYGHEQGDNAPVSEAATAAYTTVLNQFLATGSRHRIQIGDASTVFWAESANVQSAADAEGTFAAFLDTIDEEAQAAPVKHTLDALRNGRLIAQRPDLADNVRFYVLGLAPNAARLSIRFWFEDDFAVVAQRLKRHSDALKIEPPGRNAHPPLWLLLNELAVQGKRENVPPNLAGEWLRAILSGAAYPQTLQSAVLMRIRAEGEVNAFRVAILKAGLISRQKEAPVAFDPTNENKGYLLGRLFAIYEQIQVAALGRSVNATIRDKFYGSASATPRKVFPVLDRGSTNHLSKVRKEKPGYGVNLDKMLGGLMAMLNPAGDPFPNALNADEQALFAVGYYHQKSEFFRKADAEDTDTAEQGAVQ